jgi:hypothetical protein
VRGRCHTISVARRGQRAACPTDPAPASDRPLDHARIGLHYYAALVRADARKIRVHDLRHRAFRVSERLRDSLNPVSAPAGRCTPPGGAIARLVRDRPVDRVQRRTRLVRREWARHSAPCVRGSLGLERHCGDEPYGWLFEDLLVPHRASARQTNEHSWRRRASSWVRAIGDRAMPNRRHADCLAVV